MLIAGFFLLIIASIIHCWYAANHAAAPGDRAIGYFAFGQFSLYIVIFLIVLGTVIVWLASSFVVAFGAITAYFLLLPLVFLPLLQTIYKPGPRKKVSDSEWERIVGVHDPPKKSPSENTFRTKLSVTIQEASERGVPFVDVSAGDLHRRVGEYPGRDHRMPVCCRVMREEMRSGDMVLHEPPKGVGASLTIRYRLPRPGPDPDLDDDGLGEMRRDAEQFFVERDAGVVMLANSEPLEADAQFSLASYYQHGMPNLSMDSDQAMRWYRRAAEQGHSEAQIRLLEMYFYGDEIPQDYTSAAFWAQKAAEQGDAYGQLWLASFYEKGHGVQQDYSQAARWYREAASGGLPNAKWFLGMLYKTGRGVPHDISEAYFWQSLAVSEWALTHVPVGEAYASGCEETGSALTDLERLVVRRRVSKWISDHLGTQSSG